jgi:hypothetical protein
VGKWRYRYSDSQILNHIRNPKAAKTYLFSSAREEITSIVFEKQKLTVLFGTKTEESCLCPWLRGVWGNGDIDRVILRF